MTATSERGHEPQAATVQTLAAEVRTLMIGSRQVTLSVYRQLDYVAPAAIEAFGRVHSGEKLRGLSGEEVPYIEVVGRVRDGYRHAGVLARARVRLERLFTTYDRETADEVDAREKDRVATVAEWRALPLIVLAGLR